MPEINNKPSFNNKNLKISLNEFEGELIEYINQGQNLAAKESKKREVISALNNLALKLQQYCPKGTVWDQKTRTCVPIS